MRLSRDEVEAIKTTFREIFEEGDIYLFGSRTDDTQRGGDIDLYLRVPEEKARHEKKILFLVRLQEKIGLQKIDAVIARDASRYIEKEAMKYGIKL